MQGLIDGKVAVITGAGSGVGKAAALLFARHGAKVVAADIDKAWVDDTVAQVAAEGGQALAEVCDVGDAAAVERLVQSAVDTFGRLDIMYNNAGVTVPGIPGRGLRSLLETDQAAIDKVYRVNVFGVLNGCRAAIAAFERQGGPGVIVNTASVAGLIGWGGVAYGSTKGAVTNMTRTLALELAAKGIRVNSVCPAGMPTHFAGMDPDGPQAAAIRAGMGKTHPLGQVIEPMDCANAALFLASDLAANITGVNLPVDGGLSAGVPPKR